MRLVGHVACIGRIKTHAGFDEKNVTLEDQDVNREIILKWMLINRMGVCELDLCGSGQRQEAGCCQHGNYNAGSTKRGEFLDCHRKHELLEISAPRSKK
jgi:hypothetical protein